MSLISVGDAAGVCPWMAIIPWRQEFHSFIEELTALLKLKLCVPCRVTWSRVYSSTDSMRLGKVKEIQPQDL